MIAFVVRRLLATIPVLGIVAVFVFLLLRLTPGDPAAVIAGENANAAQIEEIRAKLGLDRPLAMQFAVWIGRVLQGDLGESFFYKKTVLDLILERLEPTLMLSLCTIVLAVAIAVPLGVLAAYRHETWIDRATMAFSVLGFSVPVFVIGYMLIQVFALELGWLPAADVRGIRDLVAGFGLPVTPPEGLDAGALLSLMRGDKKSSAGRIRLVLLRRIGEALATMLSSLLKSLMPLAASVLMGPALMPLTRMSFGPTASAR
jgi:peptide/nickel transport system permease protein